ncbi:MAG: type 1 glutamine amidotransferase, partial [Gammaproteobacteria bacterium]|nr:type 1 glutamine amidotransferase [Gammaproteobacteria bacterium]
MASTLPGKSIAILVADGFEQIELTEPRQALDEAGAETHVVSPADGKVKGWKFTDWGEEVPVDVALDQASPESYDALFLPGGVMNPDALRTQPRALEFVKAFFDAGKPVAVICHGPWTLIEADVVRGRALASWPSIATDIRNAGGTWVDEKAIICTE